MIVLAFKGPELLACGMIVLGLFIWLYDSSLFWQFNKLHPQFGRMIVLALLYLVVAQAIRRFWLKKTAVSGKELGG